MFLEIAEGLLPGEEWEPDLLCWILSQSLVLQIGIYAQCHVFFFVFDILSHDFPYLKPSLYLYTTNGSQLTGSPVQKKGRQLLPSSIWICQGLVHIDSRGDL